MNEKTIRIDYDTRVTNQLVEALANVWFQLLVLGILSIGVPIGIGFGLALWKWPFLVAIPVVAWWFGRWYGRFNQIDDRSGHL